jgi:hypothetical protein
MIVELEIKPASTPPADKGKVQPAYIGYYVTGNSNKPTWAWTKVTYRTERGVKKWIDADGDDVSGEIQFYAAVPLPDITPQWPKQQ